MFISKFNQWIDEVDPYTIQRIALYKSLFIATIMTYVYWIFRPASYMAFIAPFLLASFYEIPLITSFKEKERLLIFIALAIILVSVSYYLVYPFRVIFFFFSIISLVCIYFYVLNNFYQLKNLTMLIIATGAIVLSTVPPANLQVAYGIASSIALSMIGIFICLKFFPNQYLIVWNRALQKVIQCLENDIEGALTHQYFQSPIQEEVVHFSIVRAYRSMVPLKFMMHTYRMSVNIRNIQFSLDNLYYEEKNEVFWHDIKKNLCTLRHGMETKTSCGLPELSIKPDTKLQHYIVRCLNQTFIHWNKLCSKQLN